MTTYIDGDLTTQADHKSSLLSYETRGFREAIFYPDFLQYKAKAKIVCNEHTKIRRSSQRKPDE